MSEMCQRQTNQPLSPRRAFGRSCEQNGTFDDRRDAGARQKRACCRYQSLVLYLLVQRGSSLVIPVSAFRKAGKNDAF
jgi:hypothetical protein